MIYFTSDFHFCHDREFIYKRRGFKSLNEMEETIIERYNSVVDDCDTVYILGDVITGNIEKGIELFNRLKGIKKVIWGNHDTYEKQMALFIEGHIEVGNYADMIEWERMQFYLSHYPTMVNEIGEFHSIFQTISLYGHTHQTISNFYEDRPNMYHVGIDSHNFYPVSAQQIKEDIEKKCKECLSFL